VVSSPTFVLLNVYETPRGTVYHFDAYRIRGQEEFEGIGFGEILEEGGVVVVEWAQKVEGLLPRERIEVRFTVVGRRDRAVEIEGET
jgi:tRNA threonylcarbamoyladenosine biosynthesis protein TsaE